MKKILFILSCIILGIIILSCDCPDCTACNGPRNKRSSDASIRRYRASFITPTPRPTPKATKGGATIIYNIENYGTVNIYEGD
jgi:hypothetical protein